LVQTALVSLGEQTTHDDDAIPRVSGVVLDQNWNIVNQQCADERSIAGRRRIEPERGWFDVVRVDKSDTGKGIT
jgi:hypothetical protein